MSLVSMKEEDICFLSACDMIKLIKNQEIMAIDITEAVIKRIEKINPINNAYCTLTLDLARKNANTIDNKVKNGEKLRPLEGIPISIKDLIETMGIRTTFGSKIFEFNFPEEDNIVYKRLIDAGAVMLGKTNTPEFGHKGVTDNLIFGTSRNPWDLEHTTGGSSGGAGAAIASGLCQLAIGTDSGGSIRIPSSFCGTYGFKPTFGRVPSSWMKQVGSMGTIEHKGPLTRFVRDAALMMDIISGNDLIDRYSLPKPNYSFLEKLNDLEHKLKIGYSLDLGFVKAIEPEVEKNVLNAVNKFEELNWDVEKSDIEIKNSNDVWSSIWVSGFTKYLDQYMEEWGDKIDPILKSFFNYLPVINAQPALWFEITREEIYYEVCRHFKKYDILITPTTAITASKLGFPVNKINGIDVSDNPLASSPYTPVFNLSGHPAASIPCGRTPEGLPIGMMIVGRRLDDLTVLQVSQSFEKIAPWQKIRPNFD